MEQEVKENDRGPAVANPQDIVEGIDGGYSITFKWKTEGVNTDTESVKFLPYTFTETDSDGKAVPFGVDNKQECFYVIKRCTE